MEAWNRPSIQQPRFTIASNNNFEYQLCGMEEKIQKRMEKRLCPLSLREGEDE